MRSAGADANGLDRKAARVFSGSRQYPGLRPTPLMYRSPTSPGGTRSNRSFSTSSSSPAQGEPIGMRSEEHTSELQSRLHLVCRLLLEKKKKSTTHQRQI